jgi:pimeloyl-ACP methyl ester carboxylesterase
MIESVLSKDGTTIAYLRTGTGAPVLLVHGATDDHRKWPAVAAVMERQHYCVYAMERRGRGLSGDAHVYAVEREWEDVAALVDAIGGAVDVVGHSFGGLCALEAARLTANVRRLVLYEPTFPLGAPRSAVSARLHALRETGDREELLRVFLVDVLGLTPQAIAARQKSPRWAEKVSTAYTIPRELDSVDAYTFDPARFGRLRVPTLILVGGESPPVRRTEAEQIRAALVNSEIGVLPGHGHGAIENAPEQFAEQVVTFLSASA